MGIFDNYKDKSISLWKDHHDSFNGSRVIQQLKKNGEVDESKSIGYEVSVLNENNSEKRGGLLFVGCNPAGTDYDGDPNPIQKQGGDKETKTISDFYVFNPYTQKGIVDKYTETIDYFAKSCFVIDKNFNNYFKLDVFGILQATQSVLVDDIEAGNHVDAYKAMFKLFVDTVKKLKPSVILFANAFITRLILENKIGQKLSKKQLDAYQAVKEGSGINCWENNSFGGFVLDLGDGVKSRAFFTSMLSGQRGLDLGSRHSLKWLVKNSLKYKI